LIFPGTDFLSHPAGYGLDARETDAIFSSNRSVAQCLT